MTIDEILFFLLGMVVGIFFGIFLIALVSANKEGK